MGLSAERLKHGIDALAALEPNMAAALARVGYPEPRIRQPGYGTLLRTIVGQQVSVKAAASVFAKLEAAAGDAEDPAAILALDAETMRACGLSRQKASYARSLAELTVSGELRLDALPEDDEAAIAELVKVKGIGRWSAEIYLLFAEGRGDVWPGGDLAVQIELGRVMGLGAKPSEAVTRELAEGWRPHRGAAAVFLWHHYGTPMVV